MESLNIFFRYIGTYMFLQPMLLIKDLNLIKQIFVKDFDSFVDRNYTAMTEDSEPLFGRCLFFLEGIFNQTQNQIFLYKKYI